VDADGNVENPYAQLGEWVDERLHGATAHAHDGQSHSIEIVAWAALIDSVLSQIDGGNLHAGKQVRLDDDSVNFVINQMDLKHMGQVSSKMRTQIPSGCELRMGDSTENAARAVGVARRPRDREFFINVTPRAQSNLEWRRKMAKRVRSYDSVVFFLSFIGMIVFGTLLYKHGEGYRHPFETLAETASKALSLD
jgi:hypothetical protein